MSPFGACPQCGSRNIRSSRIRGLVGHVKSVVGILPFRCRECNHRFESPLMNLKLWRFARCPKCLRTELSTWSEHYYNPPFKTKILIRIGATPYRCERCRCNFASFRSCRERFSWRNEAAARSTEKAG